MGNVSPKPSSPPPIATISIASRYREPESEDRLPSGIFKALEALEEQAEPMAEQEEHTSRTVWRLAWPAVALNSMQVVNNVLDRGFLGRLEEAAMTGMSGSMNMTFFMFNIIGALATAPTALVSRAFGAQNHDEMRQAFRQSVSMSIIVGVCLALLTVALAFPSAALLSPPGNDAARVYMAHYLLIYAIGLPALSIIQNLAASLRGIGDTKSPMYISGLQIVMHITLNFLLIFPTRSVGPVVIPGAGMGLMGACTALVTSSWVSAIIYMFYSAKTPLGSAWHLAWPHADWSARILRIASPQALSGILRVMSMWVYSYILAHCPGGSAAMAAMGPGFAIESIMFMPSFGLSMAAAALVGQSLGMKKPDRAERIGWNAAHWAGFVTLVLCVPLAVFAHYLAALLAPGKPDVIYQTAKLIQWVCATEIAFAYFGVTVGAMQGAGDTKRPMYITILSMWFVRVPLAVVLALGSVHVKIGSMDLGVWAVGIGWGGVGAWIAMSMSQLVQGILAVWYFKLGRWKHVKV